MSKSIIERELETIKMANGFVRIRILHAEDEMMTFDESNQQEET